MQNITDKRMMRVASLLLLFLTTFSFGQSFNADRVEMANYLRRMFNSAPFEGVRVVEDYNSCYLISVLTLDNSKYSSESALNRVASVKAMSQASRYLNGSEITSETIIHTDTDKKGFSDTEIIENIKERSVGYVKELELFTSFSVSDNRTAFIFGKQLVLPQKSNKKAARNKRKDI